MIVNEITVVIVVLAVWVIPVIIVLWEGGWLFDLAMLIVSDDEEVE